MGLSLTLQVVTRFRPLPDFPLLQREIESLFADLGTATVMVRIVDTQESASLNATYRQKSGPTNVLSFPFEVPASVPNEHLGDLVVCAEVVAKEAEQQGKHLHHHWAHILVHGLLHLQGYDHEEPAQADIMEQKEIALLQHLGVPDPYTAS